jgi:hypothetical protein
MPARTSSLSLAAAVSRLEIEGSRAMNTVDWADAVEGWKLRQLGPRARAELEAQTREGLWYPLPRSALVFAQRKGWIDRVDASFFEYANDNGSAEPLPVGLRWRP